MQNPQMSRFEITESVFGQQAHGRVIGMGSGVRPTSFRSDQRERGSSSSSSSTQQPRDDIIEQNRQLREKVEQMRAQHGQDMEQMRAQQELLQKQMADILARFAPPPPPDS